MIFHPGPGQPYLERDGERVALTPAEAALFANLTPMGRRIRFRRRALELAAVAGEERKAGLLLAWSSLAASEWRVR